MNAANERRRGRVPDLGPARPRSGILAARTDVLLKAAAICAARDAGLTVSAWIRRLIEAEIARKAAGGTT